jgi:spore maturation protein SpmB
VKQWLWLMAMMLPIGLAVTVLRWLGVLEVIAVWLTPAVQFLGLPGESAIALITAGAVNLFSGVAVLQSLVLTDRQITILALMMLICHNLPVELAVQRRAGSSALRMLALRVVMAVVGGVLLNLMLPSWNDAAHQREAAKALPASFWTLLGQWALAAAWGTVGRFFTIVVALMILHEVLQEFGAARFLVRVFAPILRLIGLPRETAYLWIVANTLGLGYGGPVIWEEVRAGRLKKPDAELLNRSVAVCHSLLEDTLVFVWLGVSAVWITLPRLAMAAAAVWLYRAVRAGRPVPQRAEPTLPPPPNPLPQEMGEKEQKASA